MLISSNWLQKKKDLTAKLFTSKPVYIIRFIDQISFFTNQINLHVPAAKVPVSKGIFSLSEFNRGKLGKSYISWYLMLGLP